MFIPALSDVFSRVFVIASPQTDFAGPEICSVHLERAHRNRRVEKGRGGGEGVPRVEDPASPRDEKREGERGGNAHPGRVGRDNHWTDTDMLISESFTRDI